MPSLSVVIPARNEEAHIGKCLDLLTRQLNPGDEVLVLDNGSSDRTAPIAQTFEGVTVIHAPDARFEDDGHYRGLSRLRQFGAESANNEVIVSTDADTLPPEDWLDRIRAHFEDDPDLAVLWGVVTDTNGVPVRDLTGKYLTFLGGVSGCNTAFRKAAFDDLKRGYVGWPMFEDVALVTRLARTGKAKHDTSLVMRSNLDRRRYQTIPMLAGGGAGVIGGALLGGPVGALAAGSGIGLGGTELFYEQAPETRWHHDQVGMLMVLAGLTVGGAPGLVTAGTGTGVLAHHLLTEGASALPTDLLEHTDEVCVIDEEAGVSIECVPRETTATTTTRVLAAATAGGIAAKALSALRGG